MDLADSLSTAVYFSQEHAYRPPADICRRHKLATADAIIYATALASGADLLTCDRHFAALPEVRYVAKALS
jgi:predicted nucleic acid-binding protein